MVGNQIVPSSPLIREVKKEWNEGQCQLFHSNERRGETYPPSWEPKTFLECRILLGKIDKLYMYIHYVSSQLWLGVKSFLNEVDRSKSKNTLTGKEKDGFYTIRYVCQRFDDSRRSGWKFQFNWQSTILMENEIKWFFSSSSVKVQGPSKEKH